MADLTCFRALREWTFAERYKRTSQKCTRKVHRDVKFWTNKVQFRHMNMETERNICVEVYMRWEFCVIYGFMGFMISGNGGIEWYEQKWRSWKMDWKLLVRSFMILEGETNDPKRTSDKHDVDLSRIEFNVTKMTTVIVLRNNQIALQIILIFIIFHSIFNCR